MIYVFQYFFFSSRRRHTRWTGDWSSDVCSSDLLVRVFGLEVQKLRHDQVRDLVVDRGPQEDDALVEQPAVDVECSLSARGLLDNHRYQGAHDPRFFLLERPESCPGVTWRRVVECSSAIALASSAASAAPSGAAGGLPGRLRLAARRPQLTRRSLGALLLRRPQLLPRAR